MIKDNAKEIPYVDSLPSHWNLIPNKFIFFYDGYKVGQNAGSYQLLSLTTQGVKIKDINSVGGKVPISYETYQTVKKGQIVFCLFDLDCSAVFAGISNYDGMITSAYDVFSVKDIMLARYGDYWFQYVFSNRYYKLFSKNIRYTITNEVFGTLKTPVPPVREQQFIADFLDKKCAEIDCLIAHEETMIDELKAYKQSVITEAVTKGLDCSVPMKDSGVEWIGEIPEHWLIMPLKSKFNFGKGLSITKADLVSEGIKVISYGQIHAKYNKSHCINKSLYRFVDSQYLQICPSALVRRGDFIFADTSEDVEGSGDFVYIDNSDLIFAGYHCITLKNKNLHDGKYLAFLFMSQNWKNQIQSQVNGVKLFSITKRYLADAKLLLPPQNEQQQIADYLDKKCAEIDQLISLKQEKIEELRDYKKSLIYEYVTGKKEVG